jgi:hypothetical protein
MALLFRLPLMLIELLLRRLFGRGEHETATVVTPDAARAAAQPAPPVAPVRAEPAPAPRRRTPPPPSADEALRRRAEREATAQAAPDPEPSTPLRPISGHDEHIDREETLVESFGPEGDVGDVGGTITVDEPWDGYATMPASAIVARLRGSDPATKGVVALYERAHKNRTTVLRAAR